MTKIYSDFVLKTGREEAKAKEFMQLIGNLINGMKSMPIADMAYRVLDVLYQGLTQEERDFGYNVSMVTEDSPFIQDIMYDADYGLYRRVTGQHGEYGQDDHRFLTYEECFKTFWHVCAQQMMQGLPLHDFDKAKLHIESNVASMFNGNNRYNYHFSLTYIEKDLDDNVFYTTSELGNFLIPSTFSF